MLFRNAYAGSWTLPMQATQAAKSWDGLYWFLTGLSLFFFVLVVGLMLYFVVAYRKREGGKSSTIEGHVPLEIMWTAIPTVLVMIIFVWGWAVYKDMVRAPTNALEIRVVGKQWSWAFQYEDGRTTSNALYVPVNKPVRLVLSSQDVIHGFFIPNFRVKKDVVPGMYTYINFEANVPGKHQVFCTEYCGTAHSGMLADLYVLTDEEWSRFQRGKTPEMAHGGVEIQSRTLAEMGKDLSHSKGCVACHSADGAAKIGPSYKGLFMSKRRVEGGDVVRADENYIRESIEKPMARVVEGFTPTMPTYVGQVSEEEMNALVAYIKSLQ